MGGCGRTIEAGRQRKTGRARHQTVGLGRKYEVCMGERACVRAVWKGRFV